MKIGNYLPAVPKVNAVKAEQLNKAKVILPLLIHLYIAPPLNRSFKASVGNRLTLLHDLNFLGFYFALGTLDECRCRKESCRRC